MVSAGQMTNDRSRETAAQLAIAATEREHLSLVLGRIYDCATDPAAWPAALKAVAGYVDSDAVAIDFQDIGADAPVAGFSCGYPPGARETLIERYARLWALQSGMADWDVGMPRHLPDILPQGEFEAGIFYREWVRPNGQGDYLGLLAHRDAARFVIMTNTRLAERGPYARLSLDRMAVLGPHIARTVAISDAFEMRAVETGLLESTLDALSAAVFVLRAGRHVSYRNDAAEQLLGRKDAGLAVRRGRLGLPPAASARLDALLSDSSAGPAATFPLQREDGEDRLAIAFAMGPERREGGALGEGLTNSRTVLLFVREPFRRLPIGGEAVRGMLGLTPAETRVAVALAAGLAPAEVADALGLSVETVRVHLRAAYGKAGVSRQAELVALLREIGRTPG